MSCLAGILCVTGNAHSGEAGSYTRQVQIEVQIHPELPQYLFLLTPDTVYISSNHLNGGQIVKIEGEYPTDPAHYFVLHDINFDGYLDFATRELGGAKWGFYHYRIFDPESGQFVTNWLTKQLDKFPANRLYPDGKSKQIHVENLVISEGRVSESYEIQDHQLVLVASQEKFYDRDRKESFMVTKKRIDGEMKVVTTEPK